MLPRMNLALPVTGMLGKWGKYRRDITRNTVAFYVIAIHVM
jgi:hypothetical protein